MKKAFKIVLITLLTSIVVGCIAILFFVATIDDVKIKDKLTSFVYDATGRKLYIEGNVSWQIVPTLGIKINDITLQAPQDFNPRQFITIKTLAANIKILPLILGRVVVDNLNIDGLNLYFLTNVAGKDNWQKLLPMNHSSGGTSENTSALKVFLTKLRITNGSILWYDQKLKKKIYLSHLKLSGQMHRDKTANIKLSFACYQGKGSGTINANFKNSQPQLTADLHFIKVQMQPLLLDLAKQEKFSGLLTIKTHLALQGMSCQEILHGLKGDGAILISNGSYQGIDIPYEIKRALTIIKLKPLPLHPATEHTNFTQLDMNYKITNSVFSTDNILVTGEDYHITGKGSANLSAEHLDFMLNAYSNHDARFFVPVKITGNISSPTVRPDTAIILDQTLKAVVQNVVQKPLNKQLQKLGEHLVNILPFKIAN